MIFSLELNRARLSSLFKHRFEYINMHVTNNIALLFAEDEDLFIAYDTQVKNLSGYEQPVSFRVPKKLFISMIGVGDVDFRYEDKIYVRFNTQTTAFDMEFEQQVCHMGAVDEKLKLVFTAHEYQQFPVAGLKPLVKVLGSSQSPLVIENGYAFASYHNAQLYMKTICNDCAIFPAALSYLLGACEDHNSIYDVKNFIVATSNHCHVMINKAIATRNSDIAFINKTPVDYQKSISFVNAQELIQKVRDYETLELNLDKNTVTLRLAGCSVSADVTYRGRRQGNASDDTELVELEYDTPKISIAPEVIKGVIYSLKSTKIDIAVSKRMVRLFLDNGVMIVC